MMIRTLHPAAQRGMVLLVGIVLLMVISIVALAGMRTSILEERMAANLRHQNLVHQAAEAALRAAEKELERRYDLANDSDRSEQLTPIDNEEECTIDPDADPPQAPCILDAVKAFGGAEGRNALDLACDSANGFWLGPRASIYQAEINELPERPRYLIEWLNAPLSNGYSYYRITAWAAGKGAASCVVLQTTYKKHDPQ